MTRLYLVIRNWVDACWTSTGQWRVLLLPSIVFVLLAFPFMPGGSLADALALFALIGAAVVWQIFVFWRSWHYMKRAAEHSGRRYEAKTRYDLPPEYADSEDAITAAKRRRGTKASK